MNKNHLLFILLFGVILGYNLKAEPGFNGSAPGCSGTGCHSFQDNLISVVPLSNFQVQVTLMGTTSNVGGELVNENGAVVASINSTSNNPFILTAPSEGSYLVNAGFKNPSPRRWDSTHVVFLPSLPPNPPSNLIAQFIPNPLSVELNWSDNSNNEGGFIIERESQGPNAFSVIDTVPPNTTFYLDNSVTYLTYIYRISAYNEFGQSSYSDTAQVVVPVELISFNASVNDQGVLLEWITATENNNMGFGIERKLNADWETIGFVEGRGTSSEISEYSFFNDLSELEESSNLKYRLKQIDYSGVFVYSDIVEINFSLEKFSLEQNYPNPFNPSTKITFIVPKNTPVTLKVFDIVGNEITTLLNQQLTSGKHTVEFNSGNLSSGIYLYRIQAGEYSKSKKMILMK